MAKSIKSEMNHQEVIRQISLDTGIAQTDIRSVLDSYKDLAQRHIQKGGAGAFRLLGLVKLERAKRKARSARNPKTGEQIRVPARRVAKTKPLSGLKNLEL